ncbi:Amino-acid acetyltransferase, mitochondrial [Boothiomyces sp. JEL0866]|nr:Amino-acid acetyltransferase, mitochondrial [Boothiomyces sp. JEL0866]
MFSRELIFNILGSYPTKREAQAFLRSPFKTGLVAVSPGLSRGEIQSLGRNLVQIQKLGVNPIVLCNTKIDTHKRKAHWDELETAFHLCEAIDQNHGFGKTLYNHIYHSKSIGELEDFQSGFEISLEAIKDSLATGKIPILVPLVISDSVMNLRSSTLTDLCASIVRDQELPTPKKFILINKSGGVILNKKHHALINLSEELPILLHDDRPKLEMGQSVVDDVLTINSILEILPTTSSAILASANSSSQLISNLITDKPVVSYENLGAPTLFRKGVSIKQANFNEVDRTKLQMLLEKSFGKKLKPEYWDRLHKVWHSIMIAGDYNGAIIVTNERGVIYLDKFAVDPDSQGSGVADILWKALKTTYQNMCWRSRVDNPVNKWYFDRSDGHLHISPQWTMFWYGQPNIQSNIDIALDIPASFAKPE